MTATLDHFTITEADEDATIDRCREILTRTWPRPGQPGYIAVITSMTFLRALLEHYDRIPATPDLATDRSLASLAAEVQAEQLTRVIRVAYGSNEAEYVTEGDE